MFSKRRASDVTMRVLLVLSLASATSVGLFLIRVLSSDNIRYWFLLWNLFLAWLPLLFALWLQKRLTKTAWLSWVNLFITGLWVSFLPNSFYLITDLIHLENTGEVMKLYDAVLMTSFIINGLILGYMSVYIVHRALIKRIKHIWAHLIIGLVFFSSGFAIYLGRYLRWNSWDILFNPFGLLFDVSDRFINPFFHAETFAVTAMFFGLLSSFYAVAYQLAKLLTQEALKK